ncbi:MAG: hypothetical protein ACKN9T_02020 [Candidatus Methylumidiphilus sp.]
MQINTIKQTSNDLKKLYDIGISILARLKHYLIYELGDHLEIKQDSQSDFLVTYYGYPLLFRINLSIGIPQSQNPYMPITTSGQIAAYLQPYDAKPIDAPSDIHYSFDKNGTINTNLTTEDFAQQFVLDVFEKVLKGNLILRP